jgi:hypothetical protein
MTSTPVSTRTAWLVLGSKTLPLDDSVAGYAMIELDLGYPDVRDVTNNRPDAHGIDDRTRYYGGRVITAKITAWPGGSMALDDIAAAFMPFMDPGARPELHYTKLSNAVGERVIGLRASGFASPMIPPHFREMQLSWVAPDPMLYGSTLHSVTAWSGSSAGAGRTYSLIFPRVYPAGGGASSTATISTDGDASIKPFLKIYGPISGALVGFAVSGAKVVFRSSYIIDAGHWVDVDTERKTAYRDSDRNQPVLNQLDWSTTVWPVIPPLPTNDVMSLTGTNTSGVTQVQATWRDSYIS